MFTGKKSKTSRSISDPLLRNIVRVRKLAFDAIQKGRDELAQFDRSGRARSGLSDHGSCRSCFIEHSDDFGVCKPSYYSNSHKCVRDGNRVGGRASKGCDVQRKDIPKVSAELHKWKGRKEDGAGLTP